MPFGSYVSVLPAACPGCGAVLNCAISPFAGDAQRPSPGDPSICWECGAISVYDEIGTLRRARGADLRALPAENRMEIAAMLVMRDRERCLN